MLPLSVAGDVGVAWLAGALARYEQYFGGSLDGLCISSAPDAEFDPDTSPREVWLIGDRGTIEVDAVMTVRPADRPRAPELLDLVSPLLAQHNAGWTGTWTDDEGAFLGIHAGASLAGERRSVGELYRLGSDLQDLLDAASGTGALTAQATRHLVAAGRLSLLLGQRESRWLEAKGIPYVLATEAQKWELAKDVAAFANGGEDALLILGVATREDVNGDVLHAARAFPLADMDVPAMRASLRDRIVPLIPDLDIGVVEERAGYGYGWIRIPAQPEELRPFILSGALLGASVIGTHVSIPFRAGEDTAYLDPAAVHSLLAAGRSALRTR